MNEDDRFAFFAPVRSRSTPSSRPGLYPIVDRLTDRSRSELELKAEVLRVIEELSGAGAHIYIPRADQDYAVTVGLRMLTLRKLVSENDGLYSPLREELPLLRYYANSIRHLFPDTEPASTA